MQIIGTEKRRTIVGLGLTGFSCARYLSSLGVPFRVVDSREQPPLLARLRSLLPQVDVKCGCFSETEFDGDDILIVSPGVPLATPAIRRAIDRGVQIESDVSLFLAAVDQPVIAITGSNGKSTVTTLVAEMLQAAGKQAIAAGNLGTPVLDLLTDHHQADVYVLELSSFQLECLDSVGAAAAAILNVSEDHLDRYDSFASYHAAKQRIYRGASHIVVNREDRLTDTVRNTRMRCISYGFGRPDIGQFGLLEDAGENWLVFGRDKLIKAADLALPGRHNVLNAMAAMALCRSLDIDFAPMIATLKRFTGLAHRCQYVATLDGVDFYNDSKATNVGAAIAAINGLAEPARPMVLIAGGQGKNADFSGLADVVHTLQLSVILIGEDAPLLEAAIGSDWCRHADSMESAVAEAFVLARPSGIVLLAPACASFDMFANYQQRGDVFVAAVKNLQEGIS